jgi:DNA-binding MarR family transcriptional regulator
MANRRWLTDREQAMWRGFMQMCRALDLVIEAQLAEHGLSTADYALLVPLSESPGGVLRPRDLGHATGWDRSRLAHQLRRMEQRGLVRRFHCLTDARGTMVELTPAGRQAIDAAAPDHVETVRRHFIDLLTPAEIEALSAIATRVVSTAAPSCDTEEPSTSGLSQSRIGKR